MKIFIPHIHLQTDWYVVLGNHDYRGDPQAEMDYQMVDRKWNMPASYYSKIFFIDDDTTQGVHVCISRHDSIFDLNYIPEIISSCTGTRTLPAQRIWLEKTLSDAPPNINGNLFLAIIRFIPAEAE